jgi:hypothetical protein
MARVNMFADLCFMRAPPFVVILARLPYRIFSQDEQKVCCAHPPTPARRDAPLLRRGRSERRGEAYIEPYVEPLNDARTKLADFFTILLRVAFETEDLPLSLQPVVERAAMPIPPIRVQLISSIGDAGLEIVAGRNRFAVDRLFLRDSRLLFLGRLSALPFTRFFRSL